MNELEISVSEKNLLLKVLKNVYNIKYFFQELLWYTKKIKEYLLLLKFPKKLIFYWCLLKCSTTNIRIKKLSSYLAQLSSQFSIVESFWYRAKRSRRSNLLPVRKIQISFFFPPIIFAHLWAFFSEPYIDATIFGNFAKHCENNNSKKQFRSFFNENFDLNKKKTAASTNKKVVFFTATWVR